MGGFIEKMDIRTVNLEQGRPTAKMAVGNMNMELRRAKASRVSVVKLIHGWGSSGVGGTIKVEVHKELRKKQREGFIKGFVKGEDFTPFSENARVILQAYPHVSKDKDYSRNNAGITIVWF